MLCSIAGITEPKYFDCLFKFVCLIIHIEPLFLLTFCMGSHKEHSAIVHETAVSEDFHSFILFPSFYPSHNPISPKGEHFHCTSNSETKFYLVLYNSSVDSPLWLSEAADRWLFYFTKGMFRANGEQWWTLQHTFEPNK